jgi:very-short-patch-repair endonuclease
MHKFRRQHPIGRYVVDFVCIERALIIELDGGQHVERVAADEIRTAFLQTRGFRVLRFWNNDVLRNIEGILIIIDAALKSPHPAR